MSLRKKLEKFQIITTAVCLVLIGFASWIIVNTLAPRRPATDPAWSYLFDEAKRAVYIGRTRDAAPLDEGQSSTPLPESMATVARVYVASCTKCEDLSSRFVLFMSRYRYTIPESDGDNSTPRPRYVVRQEMAFPPDFDEWFDESDPAIVERNAAAEGQCEDARQIVDCMPAGPDEPVPKFTFSALPLRPASRPVDQTPTPSDSEGGSPAQTQPADHLTVEPEKPE